MVWVPTGMTNEMTAKGRQAWQRIGEMIGRRHDPQDFIPQALRHTLIGIERQYPLALGQRQGTVFLRAETGPVNCFHNAGTGCASDHDRVVRAPRIHDDALVRECDAGKTVADVPRLVLGDAGAKERSLHEDHQLARAVVLLTAARSQDALLAAAHTAPASAISAPPVKR